MEFTIDIELREFFKLYLRILNPIKKLKTREIEVMGAILAVYYANREKASYDKLNELLFSKKLRKVIRESISMSEASYNNHLRQLREKEYLTEDNKISLELLKGLEGLRKGSKMVYKYTVNVW